MKLRWPHLVLLALLAVAGLWCWWSLHPSPDRAIRKRLRELARSASFGPNEAPLAKMLNASQLADYFSPDVTVKYDAPGASAVLKGREQVLERAMGARSALTSLKIEFPDINVTPAADGQSAVADVTARGSVSGERDPYLQELKITFEKTGSQWLIRQVETVKTLN